MNFKLCIIGHADAIKAVQTIAKKNFDHIELYKVELNNDTQASAAVLALKKIMPNCDGILFTGPEPYQIVSAKIDITVSATYMQYTKADLVHCLLRTVCNTDFDIKRISIDTIGYETVMDVYRSLDIDTASVKLNTVKVGIEEDDFVYLAEKEHLDYYNRGYCSLCITSITEIYNNLRIKKIPCALLSPSEINYIFEIKNLILSKQLKAESSGTHVVMSVILYYKNDFYIINENQYIATLENHKSAEMVALFAQKLNGAFYALGINEFIIICEDENLRLVTDNFKNIDLLASIPNDTSFNVKIGIGFGETPALARRHCIIAANKALPEDGNTAYLAYDARTIIGPIANHRSSASNEKIYSKHLLDISEDTGLSINTIYKIECLIKDEHIRDFTSHSLALQLGVTQRTANRIMNRLEEQGYLFEVGKHVIGSHGRPSRVVKINFG